MELSQFALNCKSGSITLIRNRADGVCVLCILADVATNGADDPLYVKWFGDGDYIAVVGAYESMLSSNKRNVSFRCDDIDGKCVFL